MDQVPAQEQEKSALINVKRVREASQQGQKKDQDQVVFTFDNEGVQNLLTVLTYFKNAQVNMDFRISLKTSEKGTQFPSAFVIVREMIPLADPRSKRNQNYKGPSKQDVSKARTEEIRKNFGG